MRRFCAWLFTITAVLSFTSCSNTNVKKAALSDDVLTQTVIEDDKIPITVLVKYAFSINTFEQMAEEAFPNVDIIQVGNYTSDMGIAEYAARMEHDDLTDIVMTWPLDVGTDYWSERLMDLSSLPLSGKYNTNMLNNIVRDGKLYYLPGPSQVRGIVYNKTLFEENGWSVPQDFEGFLTLCEEIEKTGVRSLQLGLKNAEVLDTAFVGYSYAGSFSKPEDAQWIANYNQGTGNFIDHFAPALDTFQTLIDRGVLKKEDLNVDYSDRERMLFTRQCAMAEDSVLLARMGNDMTGITDEFGLMPFFCPGPDGDWARLYPVCYIGVNKHLADGASKKDKEKYDLVLQLLEYISTPEGQTALAGDTGAMFSSLNGTSPPNVPEIDDLLPALTHGRFAIFPTLKNAQGALRTGLAGMVEGTMTANDVVRLVDEENQSPPVTAPPEVLGSASTDFTLVETGNFITDTMRAQSGCEIALFLDNGKDGKFNGKGVSARLYQGDVTVQDIKRILPDLKYGDPGALCKVTMSGADLLETLEYAIQVENNRSGWFYYFSGLRMSFAPAAAQGSRVKTITDADGNPIDPQRVYTVAVMDDSVPAQRTTSREDTGILISDMLAQAIRQAESISPSGDDRFTISAP